MRIWGNKRILEVRVYVIALAVAVLFPYVVTLVWSGSILGQAGENPAGVLSGKRVYLGDQGGYMDAEEYLIGVVVRQIPAEYGLEAVKAQAIIARTYLFRQMDGTDQISADDLNMGYSTEKVSGTPEGEMRFPEAYETARQAVEETRGLVICWGERLIEPLFHRASAGRTRDGDEMHPYLKSVESSADLEADGSISIREWTAEEFAACVYVGGGGGTGDVPESGRELRQAGDGGLGGEALLDSIQMVSRDEAGYVSEIQIGSHVYTGDEVRGLLGLNSSAFTIRIHEGNIRTVCQGIGHGFGFSQYGASRMAAEGRTAEEILTYYYGGVEIRDVQKIIDHQMNN